MLANSSMSFERATGRKNGPELLTTHMQQLTDNSKSKQMVARYLLGLSVRRGCFLFIRDMVD